ncbi:hypothetical protein EYR41_006111 [Orbilia oligospora]|uniref:Uncharacterized protein n=1 Tax=Orbilia oligospora TaxID=2813651 RepID=A0A8H2HS70_ORBOL|nr:hypothetical protein EYR41_006111 [Orbilia oligospora]
MEGEPIPPKVSKPIQSVHHLTVQQITKAFDIEYYREQTGSWENYTMDAVTGHMKWAIEPILKLFENEFQEFESVGFKGQSKKIKDQIFCEYISRLEERNSIYSRLAIAMLKSTEEDNNWLFAWTVNMALKNMKRRQSWSTKGSQETSGVSASASGKKKNVLTIEECE